MKIFYHATDYENFMSMVDNGIQARNAEKVVYLTEKSEDAIKFLAIRGHKDIITFKVKIYKRDEDKLFESFDHSQSFFKCRAFGYHDDIPPNQIEPYMRYTF